MALLLFPTYQNFAADSSVSLEAWCVNDKFVHVRKVTDGKGVCVKPYTADKLIEWGWAKSHSETNIAFIPAKSEDKITAYCKQDELLYTGGYYIEKNSTLIITKKQSISPNGYEVGFANTGEFSQYAYVFVDCV